MISFQRTSLCPAHWDIETCVGYIPMFMDERDERSAKEQIAENYVGGWMEFSGFTINPDNSLSYSGDPDLHPIAEGKLRNERIFVYPHAWVMIAHADGTHSIARLD